MSNRTPHVAETGAYGIEDNDVNVRGVWSNEETGRQSFGGTGGITVGADVMTVAIGNPHDAAGGLKTTDMATEAQISRRESRRAPRGFDDPEMRRESYTLAVEERIEGEAEADRKSTELAERFHSVREEAADAGAEIKSRAERCREEVTANTHYQQTTSEETPAVEAEPETNPFEELTPEQVGDVNKQAARLADRFHGECALTRASISQLLARKVADGRSVFQAMMSLKDAVERFPEVRQPIHEIDPFQQYQTTIEANVDVLWSPRGKGQRQVGLLSDGNGATVKVVVWQKSGRKPTLKEGDRVRIVRGKVNAYKRNGEYQTSIAVDADAEIHHLSHGDGPGTRRKVGGDKPTRSAWDVDSKTHQWVRDMNASDRDTSETTLTTEQMEAVNDWAMGRITEEELDAAMA
jgi:hypothetical protein